MSDPTELLRKHPDMPQDVEGLAEAHALLWSCAQACFTCADACLSEDDVAQLRACIRRCLDCADLCVATGSLLARARPDHGEVTQALFQACLAACRACAAECEKHAEMHDHCRVCAAACHACVEACEGLAGATPAEGLSASIAVQGAEQGRDI